MKAFTHRLAAASLLVAGIAGADPRNAPELAKVPPVEDAEPGAWLKRLPDRYTIDGVVHHVEYWDDGPTPMAEWSQPVASGKADCVGFADGPGLHCLASVNWAVGADGELLAAGPQGVTYQAPQTEIHNAPPSSDLGMGASNLRPGMILAGIAPSSPGTIRLLVVDDKGLAHPASLQISGDAALATGPCTNEPGKLTCEQKFRVEARPEARTVFVTFGVRTTYLRFVPGGRRSTVRVEELLEISLALRRDAPS
jgi:hypothetical protein